ncbi:hypothetical protein DUF763 [Thermacetogenium phaeum DSM 12270]|uniref:DUF763 domain-containing protein n=1 Tax=Thermacetogenium phaeum (strain ATCC BAA-254 / DSM 26808 / PB) TaxID=1089553 RepID=K4LDR5_THEPS|nr:DUF763 domain-containing protein [Thermacetogenium phaeum]AFV11171.1 hypothetical protein DUF763 [Thermacetogenium phaeum DSM 12270]
MRTGYVDLPLHGGQCPPWLFERMTRLGRSIIILLVRDQGTAGVLQKLADPFWFQALGCLLGFDWHSSGLTTTVCGALKEGLRGLERELGLFIAGGKGKRSLKTPQDIITYVDRYALPAKAEKLVYASKMSAKVDNTAVQDGYQLYHHTFIFTSKGDWAVIQQGMNPDSRRARRYHWLGSRVTDFVNEPQNAICCDRREQKVLNLVDRKSADTRQMIASLSCAAPVEIAREYRSLIMPYRHSLGPGDIQPQSLERILLKTYERQPDSFEAVLTIPGVGPKTIRALSLISELAYGARPSYQDPAKYSFAHGGKDGYPYPVDRKIYDQSISILEQAIKDAKIGREEKLEAFKRLRFITGEKKKP